MTLAPQVHPTDLETRLLLEAIFARYHYDFRAYAMASLKRRLTHACEFLACSTLSRLQERVLHEPEMFAELLQYLTIQVSDMYRDPNFFRAFRTDIVRS
jgi:chemotaxis protein methyltransferase CheR